MLCVYNSAVKSASHEFCSYVEMGFLKNIVVYVYVCGQGLPCHLYFDLEFNKQENANKNGEEMVDLLLSAVFDAFNTKYSIEGDNDWVVELDSSTQGMFSK